MSDRNKHGDKPGKFPKPRREAVARRSDWSKVGKPVVSQSGYASTGVYHNARLLERAPRGLNVVSLVRLVKPITKA